MFVKINIYTCIKKHYVVLHSNVRPLPVPSQDMRVVSLQFQWYRFLHIISFSKLVNDHLKTKDVLIVASMNSSFVYPIAVRNNLASSILYNEACKQWFSIFTTGFFYPHCYRYVKSRWVLKSENYQWDIFGRSGEYYFFKLESIIMSISCK